MRRSRYLLLLLSILLAAMLATGCRSSEKPVEETEEKKPPIPEQISQGEGQEPVLKVYVVDEGQIKEMPFEEYLVGVLAGEMNSSFPEQALAAQAILARTFVMEFVSEKGGSKYEGAHVSTDIAEAQAYDLAKADEKIRQAVESTKGLVALYDNDYIKAWFHSHAGGLTATAVEGLGFEGGDPPYIQVVQSTDSPEAPPEDAEWQATFSKGEIQQAAQASGQQMGDFSSIEISERGPSGRAVQFKIGEVTVAAPAFRLALDSMKMKSTLLTSLRVEGDQVVMAGKGYGHGVGMSQWGAYQMATEGKSAEEIVQHYFKDVKIVQLWE